MTDAPYRIMIVEDQRLVAADLETTLTEMGYTVVASAASGEEAIRKAKESVPDLILMDIRLKGEMDGIEAANIIRRQRDVPVIYLTAYADEETIRRAKLTGPYGYVVKPFNDRELRAAVEVAVYKQQTDRLLALKEAQRLSAEENARIQQQAREALEAFRILVEGVKEYAIFMLDPQGNVASWNEGAERIYGFKSETITGKSFSMFYIPEEALAGHPQAQLSVAATKDRVEEEGWQMRKDGRRFWANTVITALRDDYAHSRGFAVVTRDVTDRKRMEDLKDFIDKATVVLAGSLDLNNHMQASAQLAVEPLADWCIIDLLNNKGQLDQVASAYITGGTAVGGDDLSIELARRSELKRGAWNVIQTQKSETYPELVNPDQTGELLGFERPEALRELGVVSYMCVPIKVGKKVLGAISFLRFNPPRRFTDGDLEAAEEYARRAGLSLENVRLFHEAKEALVLRDEFLLAASHEMRTPITAFQLQLGLIAESLKGTIGNERLAKQLESALKQTQRLTRLVQNLMDVSAFSGGRMKLKAERFDFSEMVRESIDRYQAVAKNAGSDIRFETRDAMIGTWDRLRLEQVLDNLLSNAVKYGAGKPIRVSVCEDNGAVVLSVTDQGIGIAPGSLERIFDRFERASSVYHYAGLGIGLFLAKKIVEAHGGIIKVKSRLGAGSDFTVRLPRNVCEDREGEYRPRQNHEQAGAPSSA